VALFVVSRWRFALLGLLLLFVVALVLPVPPALAACTSFAPASNATVDCTGASTQGVIADASTGVTIGVHTGGSITPALNGALDPTHVNWGIDVGTGAAITIDNGGTVDTSARDQQYAVKLNSGSSLTVNGLVKGNGGVTGPVLPTFSTYGGFANSTITVGSTGQVINTEPTFFSAAIAGGGGGNHYQIDGTVKATGNGGDAIIVGDNDVVVVSGTGHLETDGSATAGDIATGLSSANHVTVTTAAGSLLETHNASGGAIGLGANANVTIGGTVHAFGDNPSNPAGQGGSGVIVGANSIVWLQSTGSIVTGGTFGFGIDGGINSVVTVDAPITIGAKNGIGIHLSADASAHINSTITVAGGGGGLSRGVSAAVGTNIVIAKTSTVSVTGTGGLAAIYLAPSTSSADNTVTVDIAGAVSAASGRGIFLTADNATGSHDVSAHANITIEAGASLIAQTNKAYACLLV